MYQGKHDPPTGPKPVVAAKDTGAFPAEFQAKYELFKQRQETWANSAHTFVNGADPSGNSPGKLTGSPDALKFISNHLAEGQKLQKELAEMKAEAIKLGLVSS